MSELHGHVSVVMCHYGLADDFGEERAREHIQEGKTRSLMMADSIMSLEIHTDYPSELIVIDNGPRNSSDSLYLNGLVSRGVINTYIHNKNNMYFGWAWNQGAALATGEFICFTCNDIYFNPNWLSQTIKPLIDHPEEKYIATPLITPDKDNDKYSRGTIEGGYRLNSLAGSACMIMRKEVYKEVGQFSTHRIAGTQWHQRMRKLGYLVVAPPENVAIHLANKGGVNFYQDIRVTKTLLTGEVLDYSI